ncbi:hypothetical protein V2O64_07155 [Verrucomicrobiaceae bacterium 227]
MKFYPPLLPVIVIIAWLANNVRQSTHEGNLDQKISESTRSGPKYNKQVSHRIQRIAAPINNDDQISAAREALSFILAQAGQSNLREDFHFQIQTALQVLTGAEGLTTHEFISLIEQLEFPEAPGRVTKLIMSRIAAQEAPEFILRSAPHDLWSDFNIQYVAFSKLLETQPETCREWFSAQGFKPNLGSHRFYKRILLNHSVIEDPKEALAGFSNDELMDPGTSSAMSELIIFSKLPAQSHQRWNTKSLVTWRDIGQTPTSKKPVNGSINFQNPSFGILPFAASQTRSLP